MIWMLHDIQEVEIEIITGFWVIRKLQYIGIYSKLNHRNKWCSSSKLSDNNLDDKVGYSYLCGGNNKFNIVDTQSQP